MDYASRFSKRKKILEDIKYNKNHDFKNISNSDISSELMNGEIDLNYINRTNNLLEKKYTFSLDLEVSEDEVTDLLTMLEAEFNAEKFGDLANACKRDVIKSIITPFGLGSLVGRFDKNGGNVDTINNVRAGIYATKIEKDKFDNQESYNSDSYHSHENYKKKNAEVSATKKNGELKDSYTGGRVERNAKIDLDHTIAAKEIHEDSGRVLSELSGEDLANADSNLNPTDRSINRSMKEKSVDEYNLYDENKKSEYLERKKNLSEKSELSEKEQKELNKLNKLEEYSPEKAKKLDEKARSEYNNKINKEYYTSKKFIKNTVSTGVNEGFKMGFQQALGVVFVEFFESVFDEIQDIYKNSFAADNKSFLENLRFRLMKIAKRVAGKWKDAVNVFKEGFISGFLSNMVTVIINAFVRTGKRVVRIIREGFFSLLKAVKILCFPPEGMTRIEAAHEASKLIATGLVVVGGVLGEEAVEGLISSVPILAPFANILSNMVVGAIIGLLTTFIVYYIDKVDFLKVNSKEKHAFMMEKMETEIVELEDELQNSLDSFGLC